MAKNFKTRIVYSLTICERATEAWYLWAAHLNCEFFFFTVAFWSSQFTVCFGFWERSWFGACERFYFTRLSDNAGESWGGVEVAVELCGELGGGRYRRFVHMAFTSRLSGRPTNNKGAQPCIAYAEGAISGRVLSCTTCVCHLVVHRVSVSCVHGYPEG